MKLLIFAVSAAAISPFVASGLDLSTALVLSFVLCSSIWLQEAIIIQHKYKQENINFTRRFRDKFGNNSTIIGFLPWFMGSFIILYLVLLVQGEISTEGWVILALSFLSLIRIFDPLLGCISNPDTTAYISVLAYIVIFSFAITSALDPSKLEYFPLPILIAESLLFILIVLVVLQLRLAYYQKYCFLDEQNLERQMILILFNLLILAVVQTITIAESIEISSILGR